MIRVLAGLVVAMVVMLVGVMPRAVHAQSNILETYAIVLEDASLLMRGRHIYLHGVFVPTDDNFCDRRSRPVACGTRAAVALDTLISGFVRCELVGQYDDGSFAGICSIRGKNMLDRQDLGAYLISNGLALAGPDAPFEYRGLERIAEANNRGFWGFQVDIIGRRHPWNGR